MRRGFARAHVDLLMGGAFLVLVFVAKSPVLDSPYYWDEVVWAGAARWLSEHDLWLAIPGLRPDHMFLGHPPGLHVLLAALFKVFGDSRVVAHLLAVTFAFIGVYFTYRLGGLLSDRGTGALAALALFFSPIYFAQSAMFLGDVAVAALGVASIYFALRRAYAPYLVSAVGLVLAKETGAAIVMALLVFLVVTHAEDRWTAAREVVRYGLPFLVIGVFVAWQGLVTGQFFFILGGLPHNFFDVGWTVWGSKLKFIARWLFWDQLRFVLTALIVLGLVRAPTFRSRPELRLFALIIFFSCAPFVFIYMLHRYMMPALPLLYIVGMAALTGSIRSTRWRLAAGGAFVALSLVSLSDMRLQHGNGETTMSYRRVIQTAQAMYAHIGEHYPAARVLAAWPDSANLSLPYIGYVKTPMRVFELSADGSSGEFDLLLVSWPSDGAALQSYTGRQRAAGAVRLVKRFEEDGIVSELYARSTPSSVISTR